VNIGSGEFLVIAIVSIVFLVFPVWSLADAVMRTPQDFDRIGQSRTTWIVLLLLGVFCFGIVGAVLGIYYLLSVRPKLQGRR
jgi:hypothetical protein